MEHITSYVKSEIRPRITGGQSESFMPNHRPTTTRSMAQSCRRTSNPGRSCPIACCQSYRGKLPTTLSHRRSTSRQGASRYLIKSSREKIMRLTDLVFGVCVAMLMAVASIGRAETPQQSSAKGSALLAKGDYDDALAAYTAATRAVPGNQEYRDQYSTVRRIVQLRVQLRTEKGPQRWEYTARALHNLYVGQGLLTEAASLARELHATLKTESSAILLAETEPTMNRNAAAAEVLTSLDKGESTAASKVLLAIAIARQGKMDLAREVTKTVPRWTARTRAWRT